MTNPYFHPDSYGTDGERFQQTRDMAIGRFDRHLEPRRLNKPLPAVRFDESNPAWQRLLADLRKRPHADLMGILPKTSTP